MKNVTRTFAILLAFIALSCTKDEGKDSVNPNSIQKATVLANIVTNQTTAKNVNRGSIYAWINSVNVTATSTAWAYSTSEVFNLVTSGGASNFTIENVALGANNFVATTTTNTVPVKELKVIAGVPSVIRAAMVAHNPYATYSGTKSATISQTALNVVDFNMTTNHGRVISVFSFENDPILRANTKAKITVKIGGVDYATSNFFSGTDLVTFEWSDNDAVDGKQVDYTISIYDINGTLITSYPVVGGTKVKASKSISCHYEINREKVISVLPDEVTFKWQLWVEQECESTFDNDGYNCLGFDAEGYDKDGCNKGGFNRCGWHKAPNIFYNIQQDKDLSDGDSKSKCK